MQFYHSSPPEPPATPPLTTSTAHQHLASPPLMVRASAPKPRNVAPGQLRNRELYSSTSVNRTTFDDISHHIEHAIPPLIPTIATRYTTTDHRHSSPTSSSITPDGNRLRLKVCLRPALSSHPPSAPNLALCSPFFSLSHSLSLALAPILLLARR